MQVCVFGKDKEFYFYFSRLSLKCLRKPGEWVEKLHNRGWAWGQCPELEVWGCTRELGFEALRFIRESRELTCKHSACQEPGRNHKRGGWVHLSGRQGTGFCLTSCHLSHPRRTPLVFQQEPREDAHYPALGHRSIPKLIPAAWSCGADTGQAKDTSLPPDLEVEGEGGGLTGKLGFCDPRVGNRVGQANKQVFIRRGSLRQLQNGGKDLF